MATVSVVSSQNELRNVFLTKQKNTATHLLISSSLNLIALFTHHWTHKIQTRHKRKKTQQNSHGVGWGESPYDLRSRSRQTLGPLSPHLPEFLQKHVNSEGYMYDYNTLFKMHYTETAKSFQLAPLTYIKSSWFGHLRSALSHLPVCWVCQKLGRL